MATGLILWISCLSLLLDASDGFAVSQDGDYRLDPASQNLDDDSTLTFDQGEGDAFDNQLSGLIPPNYIQPLLAQPPKMVPLGQEAASPQSGNEMVKVLNGVSRQWESNLLEPITFPLLPSYQVAVQKLANQPQSAPIFYTSKNAISPITGLTPPYGSPKPAQSYPYVAASSQFWQPAGPVTAGPPYGSLYPQVYTGSSQKGDSSNPAVQVLLNRLPGVSEEPLSTSNMVEFGWPPAKYGSISWQTPPQLPRMNANPQSPAPFNPAEQSSQGNEIRSTGYAFPLWKLSRQAPARGQSSNQNWINFPVSNENPYLSQMSQWPQNSVANAGKYWVPRVRLPPRASQFVGTRPLRKSFVVRSKNAYQRKRFLQTKTTYTPKYEFPQMTYGYPLGEPAQKPASKPVQGSITQKL